MSEPLENLYFNWLCAKVTIHTPLTPSVSYWTLFRTLHNTEFVWTVLGDDNREADGRELRRDFILEADIADNLEWRSRLNPCSVFEMLIAFSKRVEFQMSSPAREWFWEFLKNLGLDGCNEASGVTEEEIAEVLDTFLWRTYDYSGFGGLFPLEHARRDQRDVEIWYQFYDYLADTDQLI